MINDNYTLTKTKILSGLQSLRGLPSGAQSRQKSQYFAMKKKGGGGASGIWVNKKITEELSEDNIVLAVSVLYTGKHQGFC